MTTIEPAFIDEPATLTSRDYVLHVDVPLSIPGPPVRWLHDGEALDVSEVVLAFTRTAGGGYEFSSGTASGIFPGSGTRGEGSGMRIFTQTDIEDGIVPLWLRKLMRDYRPTFSSVALHAPETAGHNGFRYWHTDPAEVLVLVEHLIERGAGAVTLMGAVTVPQKFGIDYQAARAIRDHEREHPTHTTRPQHPERTRGWYCDTGDATACEWTHEYLTGDASS